MTKHASIALLYLSLLAGSSLAAQPYDDLWIGRYSGQVQASIKKSGPDSFRVNLRLRGRPQCHVNLSAAPERTGMSLALIRRRQVVCTVRLVRRGNQLVIRQDKTCPLLPPDCTFNGTATLDR